MPVLLIIDMQPGMTWPRCGARNKPQAEANIQPALAPRDDERVVEKNRPDAFELTDLRGVRHPAEEVQPMTLANLHGRYATVIDTEAATTLLHAR